MLRHGVVALLTASVLAAGCGSSDSPTGPSVGGGFSQTIAGMVGVFSETRHPFSVPASGTLTLRLAWNDSNVDLDLYLANSSCSESLYPLNNCDIVAQSIAATGTTETVTRVVSAGQQYQIWVDNLSVTTAMNYTVSIEID